jgi:hypothetical protein
MFDNIDRDAGAVTLSAGGRRIRTLGPPSESTPRLNRFGTSRFDDDVHQDIDPAHPSRARESTDRFGGQFYTANPSQEPRRFAPDPRLCTGAEVAAPFWALVSSCVAELVHRENQGGYHSRRMACHDHRVVEPVRAGRHPTTPVMTAKRKEMTTTHRQSPTTGLRSNILPKSVHRISARVGTRRGLSARQV